MPISVHINRSLMVDDRCVMLTAPESLDDSGVRPWIYIHGPTYPDGLSLVMYGAPSWVLVDWLIEHMASLVRYRSDDVLSCLRGEDMLCDRLADTTSNPTLTPHSPDASSVYQRYRASPGMQGVEVQDNAAERMLEWYRLQAIAARIHRRRRKS